MPILDATVLPFRAIEKGEFCTTAIYTIPGHDGLFRRISRDGRSGTAHAESAVVALIPAGKRDAEPVDMLAELVRWKDAEEQLQQVLPACKPPF